MKFDWAIRSCLSLSALVFLSLHPRIETAILHENEHPMGIAFSAFACIIAIDYNVGGTTHNILSIISGAAVATVACSLTFLAFGNGPIPENGIYPIIFIFSFILGLVNLPSLGKKVALSLVAVNLISTTNSVAEFPTSLGAWWWFQDVLFGCVCAYTGTLLPYPRVAAWELDSKGKNTTVVVGTLFRELIVAWRLQRIEREALPASPTMPEMERVSSEQSPIRNKKWQKLFIVIRAVQYMKARRDGHHGRRFPWQWKPDGRCSSRSMRHEIRTSVDEDLVTMRIRAREARYGPNRTRALLRFESFVKLVEELLLVQRSIENRLVLLEELLENGTSTCIMRVFFSDAEFRSSLDGIGAAFSACMVVAGEWLSRVDPRLDQRLEQASGLLLERVEEFDRVYLRLRIRCYYDLGIRHVPEVLLSMNSLLFYFRHSTKLLSQFCTRRLASSCNASSISFADPMTWLGTISSIRWRPDTNSLGSSFTLAISMTFGALYGIRNNRQQAFLASFTIAYLLGGIVTGINIATSICRVSGTAVACLYALMVATFAASWTPHRQDNLDQKVFSSIAVILFLFPCTLIRSTSYIGYAGTVAGFSTALLLLAPPLTVSLVIDRLVDTLVGCIIFMLFEFSFSARWTQAVVCSSLKRSISSLEIKFITCMRAFVQRNEAPSSLGPSEGTPFGMSFVDVPLPSKDVLVFSSLEPSLRGGAFPSSMLESCIDNLHECHQHLAYLLLIAQEMKKAPTSFQIMPLQTHMHAIDSSVSLIMKKALRQLEMRGSRGQGNMGWIRSLMGFEKTVTPEAVAALLHDEIPISGFHRPEVRMRTETNDSLDILKSEEVKIVSSFRALVTRLQSPVTGDPNCAMMGALMPNAEVELVCAFLGCMQDFLAGLRSLESSTARLKDYHRVRRNK